ncbi:MAG: protein kinase [Phormidesmis sp.]
MVYCLNPSCLQRQDSTATNFCRDCGSVLTLAGRYRADSVMGESNFGRTLLATDQGASHCVIKQNFRRSDEFERDAQRLRKLGEHPQVPTLLDAVENELGQFWVQEFVLGENLQQRVEAKGPLAEGEVRSLLKSLLSVLEYVHSFKIIHRDIKPSNVILNGHNPPVLVDFGAAKLLRTSSANTVIGSADYAAPEQSMGQATFASDVYSLGVTCLYALTSVAPFTLYSASEDQWVWRDYLATSVESRFAEVLDKMVAQALQDRFDTVQQVEAVLQESHSRSFLSGILPNKISPEKFVPKKFVSKKFVSKKFIPNELVERAKASAANLTEAFPNRAITPAQRPPVLETQQWQKQYRVESRGGVSAIALPLSLQPYVFAIASTDGTIHLHNLSDGERIHTFPRRRFFGEGHSAAITALCFHGRVFYSASEDGTIKEWDSAECRLLNTMPTKGWIPTDLKVTADGTQLISANSDGQIVVWDIATLLPVARLAQHQRRVNGISLAPGAMASASEDGTVKLWRSVRGEHNRMLLAKTIKTEGTVRFLSFYSKNYAKRAHNCLVVVLRNEIRRYDLDSQLSSEDYHTIYISPYPITAFSLSSEGYLMLGSEDRFVTVWDVDTGECVAELAHDWGVVAIACSSAGRTVMTASADEVITVWQQ